MIVSVLEFICSWRFFLTVLLTVAAIWLVVTYVPMFRIAVFISILLGMVGIGGVLLAVAGRSGAIAWLSSGIGPGEESG